MGICLHCYKPIEKEKTDVLPDARYCIGCAKLLNDKPRRTQQEFDLKEAKGRKRRTRVSVVIPSGVDSKKYRPKLPPVLREQVFDDGRSTQVVLGRKERKPRRGSKASSSSASASWNYESGEVAVEGDVIFTDSLAGEKDHLWIVDKVETNCVSCHCEDRSSWLHTFHIPQVKLLYRKEETDEVET